MRNSLTTVTHMSNLALNEPLTTAKAADILGVSRRTLLRAVESGEIKPAAQLPGIRGTFIFTQSALADYAKKKCLPKAGGK